LRDFSHPCEGVPEGKIREANDNCRMNRIHRQ